MKPITFFHKANVLKPTALLLLPIFAINNSLLTNPINWTKLSVDYTCVNLGHIWDMSHLQHEYFYYTGFRSLQYLVYRFSLMYERIAFLTAFKLSLVKRHGWANTKLEISKKNCETNLMGFQLYLRTHLWNWREISRSTIWTQHYNKCSHSLVNMI